MPNSNSYDYITNKIQILKDTYPSLRDKSDSYIFSALSVKVIFYKNPALVLNDSDFENIVVDGQYDGGVDILLTDPTSEASNLVIGQSKYYKSITFDDVINALMKMALFYKDMTDGQFEQVNEKVQGRFLSLHAEVGDESKVQFAFFTSAPRNRIDCDKVITKFRRQFSDSNHFDVLLMFGSDIEDAIKESESRRPTVESGKINIDESDNYLLYGENAAIVNVSAFSIKSLYAQHNTNLLARNLRYHIAGRDVDKGIRTTIEESPETFWLKNNGITIVCDDFKIDGTEVKLKNFSIVNGGQTTYLIHKNRSISEQQDFYLPCKVIKTSGNTEDEKTRFSLEIAKATNSQKAIKAIDLKANSPEQIRFAQAMWDAGIYYQTKRGEVVPAQYKPAYLNTDLDEIGKLGLAAFFQMPATSRNKPSSLYLPQYYDLIFDSNQSQIAGLCRELLYIDYYFRNIFIKKFDSENRNQPNSSVKITFAHNARTICTAFVVFASRYYYGNIKENSLQIIFNLSKFDDNDSRVYDIVKDLNNFNFILPSNIWKNKNQYDDVLYQLFMLIINAGIMCYSMSTMYEEGLNASNYLKKDRNYYRILEVQWPRLNEDIKRIFGSLS